MLDKLCAGDAELRREVESLLAIAERPRGAGHPFASEQIGARRREIEEALDQDAETSTGATSHETPSRDLSEGVVTLAPGAVVGRFRIERVLGIGGMGTVYAATQDRPSRTVALKLIRPGFASAKMLRRFEVEAEILGRLSHPGIAQVYDAGVAQTPHGEQPFFAMELIDGVPLTRYAEQKNLATRERLDLMARVADAVEHAHQKGVIHRDLKPSNILVDASGQPKVLDFGVARVTDGDIQATTMRTDVGALIGTIAYMSPEQASGDPAALDMRSDVYALGVVGYQLLCGRLPYEVGHKLIHEAVRVIREEDACTLSSVDRSLRGDVETIIGKALEKELDRRYQSAAAMAADIRRYLHDEPISARPPSAIYQLRKFSRRNKALVLGVAAVFVVLIGGIAATGWKAAQARARAAELELVTGFQSRQLNVIDPQAMGDEMREYIIANAEDADRPQLRSLLAGVNFTDVATRTLDVSLLEKSIDAINEEFSSQPLVQARLLHTAAKNLLSLGLYDAALSPQARALALQREHLGDLHEDTLASINTMGLVRRRLGQIPDAHALYVEAAEGARRTLGIDHESTIEYLGDASWICYRLNRLSEAERYGRESLEASRRVLGPEHPRTLWKMNGMAFVLVDQGRLDEAEAYYRDVLAGRLRVLGEDDPSTLTAMANLAWFLIKVGRLDEAEAFQYSANEGRTRVLGAEHPHTLGGRSNLCGLLFRQGKIAEAEACYRDVLAAQRRAIGSRNHETLETISDMARFMDSTGALAEAESLYREAYEGRRGSLGPDHFDTIRDGADLALVLAKLGRADEALSVSLETVRASRDAHGADDARYSMILMKRGHVRQHLGDYAEAEIALLESHRIVSGATGTAPLGNTPSTAARALVDLYERWDEAEPGRGHDASAETWRATLPAGEGPTD